MAKALAEQTVNAVSIARSSRTAKKAVAKSAPA
jgi:hypothetical protein